MNLTTDAIMALFHMTSAFLSKINVINIIISLRVHVSKWPPRGHPQTFSSSAPHELQVLLISNSIVSWAGGV